MRFTNTSISARAVSCVVIYGLAGILDLALCSQRLNAQEPGGIIKSPIQKLAEDRERIVELKQRLIPLIRQGSDDAQAQAQAAQLETEIADLEAEVARINAFLKRSAERNEAERLAQLEATLATRDQQIAEMKVRLQEAFEQLKESDRARELPKLENATLKVFRLKYLQATTAAQTITSILGERDVRVAPDDRANSLVVAADPDSAKMIEALLMQLDEDSAEQASGEQATAEGPQPRSLLLRTYWLADGLPEGEGEDAGQFLPASVMKAMEGLGLSNPRLVCQTVNAISREGDAQPPSSFETNVPAVVLKQQARLKCSGLIRALQGERADIEARIEVRSPMFTSELSGSLAMPLGHYMVLGTANSVSFDPAQLGAGGMMPGTEGMGMGMRMEGSDRGAYAVPRGMEGGRGQLGGGDAFDEATERRSGGGEFGGAAEFGRGGMYRSRGAAIDPATGAPAASPELHYNTSHFAFVVQITEAESFPAEE